MRLLKESERKDIVAHLKKGIPNLGFGIKAENTHVEVISGIDEGLFLWLSLNYMLGKLEPTIMVAIPTLGLQASPGQSEWNEELYVHENSQFGPKVGTLPSMEANYSATERRNNSSWVKKVGASWRLLSARGSLIKVLWNATGVQGGGVSQRTEGYPGTPGLADNFMCLNGTDIDGLTLCRQTTVGVLDMGGASMQIAFEFDNPLHVSSILFTYAS